MIDFVYEPIERCARALERIADMQERQLRTQLAGMIAAGLAARNDPKSGPFATAHEVAEWMVSLTTISVGVADLIIKKTEV